MIVESDNYVVGWAEGVHDYRSGIKSITGFYSESDMRNAFFEGYIARFKQMSPVIPGPGKAFYLWRHVVRGKFKKFMQDRFNVI